MHIQVNAKLLGTSRSRLLVGVPSQVIICSRVTIEMHLADCTETSIIIYV